MADPSNHHIFNQWNNPSTPHPNNQMYDLANPYDPACNQSTQEFSNWAPAPLRNTQNHVNSFPSNFSQYDPSQNRHSPENTEQIPQFNNRPGSISQPPQINNRAANCASTSPFVNFVSNPTTSNTPLPHIRLAAIDINPSVPVPQAGQTLNRSAHHRSMLPLVNSPAHPIQSSTTPANPPDNLPVAHIPPDSNTLTLPLVNSTPNPPAANSTLANTSNPPVEKLPTVASKKRIRPHKRLLPPHEQDQAASYKRQNNDSANGSSQPSVQDPASSQQSSNHEHQQQSIDQDAPGVPDEPSDEESPSFEVVLDLPAPFNEDAPHPAAHSQLRDTSQAIVPANNPVNLAMIESLFNLDSARNAIAQEILKMSQPDREAAMVYAVLSLQPNPPEASMEIPPTETIPSTSISTPANAVAPPNMSSFVFSDTFKSHLRSFIRQTIMECKIESYHLECEPKTSLVIDYSLIRMVTRWVAQLPQTEKNTWLPPGFSQKHPQAVKMVHQIVHDSVKWDKGTLRGCLLKNLIANSISRTVNGPMPTLNQLFAHIQQHLPRASEFTQDLTIPTQVMVRFAYLRLETIRFVRSGSNARAAAWGPIDAQLLFLRSQSADYNLSWSELILQKDRLLFGSGNEHYSQLTSCDMNMPSKAEVEANIEVGRRRRATNAGEGSQVQE